MSNHCFLYIFQQVSTVGWNECINSMKYIHTYQLPHSLTPKILDPDLLPGDEVPQVQQDHGQQVQPHQALGRGPQGGGQVCPMARQEVKLSRERPGAFEPGAVGI